MAVITTEVLIDLIKRTARSVEVCVPSQDYYARRDDWQTDTIQIVDANYLIQELENMK